MFSSICFSRLRWDSDSTRQWEQDGGNEVTTVSVSSAIRNEWTLEKHWRIVLLGLNEIHCVWKYVTHWSNGMQKWVVLSDSSSMLAWKDLGHCLWSSLLLFSWGNHTKGFPTIKHLWINSRIKSGKQRKSNGPSGGFGFRGKYWT